VPQDIRERKGSFFTPQIWVEKSQEYIADVFGKNWQNEYYVWDCCAGTGNLLVGINRNIENVFASTIDESDVKAMYDRIDNGAKLLKKNVFQFDFLNDDFKKLPKALKDIIEDPKKQKKLIVYINPPYAEAASATTSSGTGQNKPSVATVYNTNEKYKPIIGKAINELFAQFFIHTFTLYPHCKLATFSTLKYINSQNFVKFRDYFKAEYKRGFVCCSDTFDNVKGKFPISFIIWDFEVRKRIGKIKLDVYDNNSDVTESYYIGKKNFKANNENKFIVDWIRNYFDKENERIGYLRFQGTDFQTSSNAFFTSRPTENDIRESKITNITINNIIEIAIYLSVRHCIPPTWLNNRDQFLYPSDDWIKDLDFQNNCFIYSLFHGQNKISSKHGTNDWIPFTEEELGITGKFESHKMSDFIAGKVELKKENDFFKDNDRKRGKLKFSPEAKDVYNAGLELWKFYLNEKRVNINASFYDIREYFQGVSNGRMNNKSENEEYNNLIGNLREKMKILAKKIEPKVYEYGFLLE